MIKKFLILFICIIFITGCKQKDEDVLKFASWGSKTEVQIINTLLKDFEKENPDVKVKFLHIPQNYFPKLHLMFASNLAPDVIFINNLNIPVYEKYLMDLNTMFEDEKKNYYPQVLDTMTYEYRLLAIPRDISEFVIFYNKDLFDKYNVEYPKSDWTIEDLLNIAKKLTCDNHYGISFEEKSISYLPYLRAFNGGFIDKDNNLIIDNENSKRGIQFYSDLRNKYLEIETAVKGGEPVFLTKNGYGTMVVLSLEKYSKLTDRYVATESEEQMMDRSDALAARSDVRLSGEEVFSGLRAKLYEMKERQTETV